jgi:hypothetical protein
MNGRDSDASAGNVGDVDASSELEIVADDEASIDADCSKSAAEYRNGDTNNDGDHSRANHVLGNFKRIPVVARPSSTSAMGC